MNSSAGRRRHRRKRPAGSRHSEPFCARVRPAVHGVSARRRQPRREIARHSRTTLPRRNLPNRLNVNVIAGLKSAPDYGPHGDRTNGVARQVSLDWLGRGAITKLLLHTRRIGIDLTPQLPSSIPASGAASPPPRSVRAYWALRPAAIRGCLCVVSLPGIALDSLRYRHEQTF